MVVVAHTLVVLVTALVGVWPLAPRPEVTTGFSPPATRWAPGHRGVDLLGHPGQKVRTAAAGTVGYVGRIAGRGIVVVDHGGTRTTYQPVSPTVKVGDAVAAGDAIGKLETFGSHCWPRACLHWGLIRGSTYLDPLTLVHAGPVRLLPLYSSRPAPGPAALTPGPSALALGPAMPAPGPRPPVDVGALRDAVPLGTWFP